VTLQAEQREKVAKFLDHGVCLHRSRQRSVPAPNSLHPRLSRAIHVHFGVVSDKDSVLGARVQALQRAAKDLGIWFANPFGVGNQDGIKGRCECQAFQLAALHANGPVRDQPEPESRCAQRRKRLGGIREKHTGAREAGTIISQQWFRQFRRQPESCERAGEQFLARSISIAIELDHDPNVLRFIHRLQHAREPFPLISNEPLEAQTTVKKRSVEIEDDGLKRDETAHYGSLLRRWLRTGRTVGAVEPSFRYRAVDSANASRRSCGRPHRPRYFSAEVSRSRTSTR
jgi:hypothetical protein